jgi:YHS domain-containing protein
MDRMHVRQALVCAAIAGFVLAGLAAQAAEKKVICAYDGSVMVQSAMKAQMNMKGKTLYFCSHAEHERFMADPAAYLRILEGKKYTVLLNFLPIPEYDKAMADMGMLDMMKPSLAQVPKQPKATHYLIVTVLDAKTGEKIEDVKKDSVSVEFAQGDAKRKAVGLSLEPMMKYHMSGLNLTAVGKYSGRVTVNLGLLRKESLDFTYEVTAAAAARASGAQTGSSGSAATNQHEHKH